MTPFTDRGPSEQGATPAEPDRPDDGRFTVLASEEKYAGPIFSVRSDELRMPGGGSARREIVDHLDAVGVVAVDDDERVIMIEQYRHPLRRRLWELPAGLMDVDGESPLVCAKRELAEEVSLAADHWAVLVDLATSPGYCTEAIRVYLATGLADTDAPQRVDEEADIRTVRVPMARAVDGVMSGAIVNATAVAGILAAARHTGRVAPAGGRVAPAGGRVAPAGGLGKLRDASDAWSDGPATVNRSAWIGDAPALWSAPPAGGTGHGRG